jgi:hypothetical protein
MMNAQASQGQTVVMSPERIHRKRTKGWTLPEKKKQ